MSRLVGRILVISIIFAVIFPPELGAFQMIPGFDTLPDPIDQASCQECISGARKSIAKFKEILEIGGVHSYASYFTQQIKTMETFCYWNWDNKVLDDLYQQLDRFHLLPIDWRGKEAVAAILGTHATMGSKAAVFSEVMIGYFIAQPGKTPEERELFVRTREKIRSVFSEFPSEEHLKEFHEQANYNQRVTANKQRLESFVLHHDDPKIVLHTDVGLHLTLQELVDQFVETQDFWTKASKSTVQMQSIFHLPVEENLLPPRLAGANVQIAVAHYLEAVLGANRMQNNALIIVPLAELKDLDIFFRHAENSFFCGERRYPPDISLYCSQDNAVYVHRQIPEKGDYRPFLVQNDYKERINFTVPSELWHELDQYLFYRPETEKVRFLAEGLVTTLGERGRRRTEVFIELINNPPAHLVPYIEKSNRATAEELKPLIDEFQKRMDESAFTPRQNELFCLAYGHGITVEDLLFYLTIEGSYQWEELGKERTALGYAIAWALYEAAPNVLSLDTLLLEIAKHLNQGIPFLEIQRNILQELIDQTLAWMDEQKKIRRIDCE
jgi:hypothetical protein